MNLYGKIGNWFKKFAIYKQIEKKNNEYFCNGGVVEWFKAQVLKTIFLEKKKIYKLSVIA